MPSPRPKAIVLQAGKARINASKKVRIFANEGGVGVCAPCCDTEPPQDPCCLFADPTAAEGEDNYIAGLLDWQCHGTAVCCYGKKVRRTVVARATWSMVKQYGVFGSDATWDWEGTLTYVEELYSTDEFEPCTWHRRFISAKLHYIFDHVKQDGDFFDFSYHDEQTIDYPTDPIGGDYDTTNLPNVRGAIYPTAAECCSWDDIVRQLMAMPIGAPYMEMLGGWGWALGMLGCGSQSDTYTDGTDPITEQAWNYVATGACKTATFVGTATDHYFDDGGGYPFDYTTDEIGTSDVKVSVEIIDGSCCPSTLRVVSGSTTPGGGFSPGGSHCLGC